MEAKKEIDIVAEVASKESAFATKKNKVVSAVHGIIKTGENKTQAYNYAEEAEVVKCLRKALVDNNLSYSVECGRPEISHVIPTRSGEMKHFIIPMVCSLTDTETGLTKSYPWYGGAADSGDKALYKAFTSGGKYFLLKTFLIPTGMDVESFITVDQPANTVVKPKATTEPKKEKAAEIPEITPESLEILRNAFTAYLINRKKELLPKFDYDFDMFKSAVMAKYHKWPTNPDSVKAIVAAIDPIDVMKDVS